MTPLLLLLAAAPATQSWSAHLVARPPLEKTVKVTVFEARALPVDSEPCVAKKGTPLLSDACDDRASTLKLIAAARKVGHLKQLASATTDATGRFTVQVPPGRLYVRAEWGKHLADFVVEPVPGVETRLDTTPSFTRRELTRELAQLIDASADPADLREVWVVGQDNPQVLKLTGRDVEALLGGTYDGTLLWGCSRVVSSTGKALGGTCAKEDGRRRPPLGPVRFTLSGRVTQGGAPRPKIKVRLLGDEPLALATDDQGQFSAEVSSSHPTVLVVAEDGELAATALAQVVSRFDQPSPPQKVDLRLGHGELFRLQVKSASGEPAVGAEVRLWHRGGQLLEARADGSGEVLAPRALQRAFVRVSLPGHRDLARNVDLAKQSQFMLEAARTLDVSFRSADGVLLRQTDVRCEACVEVQQPPSRDGRVRLVLQGEAATVTPFQGAPEVTVSRDGPVTLPPPAEARAVAVKLTAPEALFVEWSTPSGQPEVGVQYVRACFYRGCVLQEVDVHPEAQVTLTEPVLTTLEVRARGFVPGAPMPYGVALRGPSLREEKTASFDRDGVAKVTNLAPGPWLVRVDDLLREGPERWCRAGAPCELDLGARAPRLQLKGDVPAQVTVGGGWWRDEGQPMPVVDGGVAVNAGGQVVVEGTSVIVTDGGSQSLTLAPKTTVQVRVFDPQGLPVRDAVVSWGLPMPGRWLAEHTQVTDADGHASFEDLRPGNLPLRVARAGYALAATAATAAMNDVRLQPGFEVRCVVPGLQPPAFARCRAQVGPGFTEEVESQDGQLELTDLPGAPLTVELSLMDPATQSAWTLQKQVDPSREREVSFEAPRAGVRLVLPFEGGQVEVPQWGTAWCTQLGHGGFCETAAIPPGAVTVRGASQLRPPMQWRFQVPAKGTRVLVPLPREQP